MMLCWRTRLGKSDCSNSLKVAPKRIATQQICVDNLCLLGKWLHSDGKTKFGAQPVFIKLLDEHAKFHACAAKVVEAYQVGDENLALDILTGTFEEQSRKTISCLTKLNAVVEAHNQNLEPQ